MFFEEIHMEKAKRYYRAFPGLVGVYAENDIDNINHTIIKGLSEMTVKIWSEWKADTRHYSPSKTKYEEYKAVIDRAKKLIDSNKPGYDTAAEVIRGTKKFIDAVVLYRVRVKCRVM